MRQYECPQCSAPVPFESPGGVLAVCGSCHSMVVRRDVGLEAIGTMAELPPDITPLQVGAQGDFSGRRFRLLGRFRIGWTGGSWNEWYADFGNGEHGWVAEAQGFFLISNALAVPAGAPREAGELKAGQALLLDGVTYHVRDARRVHVISGEGELPVVAQPGEEWTSVELAGNRDVFAGLEYQDEEIRFFIGSYAEPREIAWEGLRPVPGWRGEPAMPATEAAGAVSCADCGGVVRLRAAGQSMAARCEHCGSLVDTSHPETALIEKAKKASRLTKPLIPLGRRGTLDGIEWEVIALIRRKDKWSAWSEYLLFNPWDGFGWLTEWRGHWNFVKRALRTPALEGTAARFDGRRYRLYSRETASVTSVQGECYWRVATGEQAAVADFIAPPHILSSETASDLSEVVWSSGAYVASSEVGKRFGVDSLPAPQGIYLNEPNRSAGKWAGLKKWAALATGFLVLMQVAFGVGLKSRRVFDERLVFSRADSGAAITTAPFEIRGRPSPVRLGGEAAVDNQWLGFDAVLVNEETGRQFPAAVTVQYYHGYDDGHWSEGGQTAQTTIPGVPPGRYHLTVDPEADPAIAGMPFRVWVDRGHVLWSNLILALIALWVVPLWHWMRSRVFEARRWAESDFTPFGTSSEAGG